MERYLTLNLNNKHDALYFGRKFLKERNKWEKEIRDKKNELDSILELSAISNSEVHSSNISKPTENTAFDRMKVEEELARLLSYKQILDYGLSNISETERRLIEGFFFTKGKSTNMIEDTFSHEFHYSPRTIKRMKNRAIIAFVNAIREIIT